MMKNKSWKITSTILSVVLAIGMVLTSFPFGIKDVFAWVEPDYDNLVFENQSLYLPDISFNENNDKFLLVYQKLDKDISAQIFNSDGTDATNIISIENLTWQSFAPKTAASKSGTYWIVVWEQEFGVFAKRVNEDGSIPWTKEIQNNVLEGASKPDIGVENYNGRFLIVWEANTLLGNRVKGEIINGDTGDTIVDNFVIMAGTEPAVTQKGYGFFVVARSSSDEINGRYVDYLGGTPHGDFQISDEYFDFGGNSAPEVSTNPDSGGQFLITWHKEFDPNDYDVLARFATFDETTTSQFTIASSGSYLEFNPTVVHTGIENQYVIAYAKAPYGVWNGDWNIYARSVNRDTSRGDEEIIANTSYGEGSPAGTTFGTEFGKVYFTWDRSSNNNELFGRLYQFVSPPPKAPTNLQANVISSSQINLTWDDNSNDETSFIIERSIGDTNDWWGIGTNNPNDETYSNGGLDSCTTYHYRVRAYRSTDGQYSLYTNETSATTSGCGSLQPFGKISPSDGAENVNITPTLTWESSGDPNDVEYWYCYDTTDDNVCSDFQYDAGSTTSITLPELEPGTTYYWQVIAYSSSSSTIEYADGSGYAYWSFTTESGPPPNAPTNLTATPISSSQINLAWSDNSDDETKFYIYKSTDGVNFYTENYVGADVEIFPYTGLASCTPYYFKVRAYNPTLGMSEYSNTASETTSGCTLDPPSPPTNLFAYGKSYSETGITWERISEEGVTFIIERAGGGTGAWSVIDNISSGYVAYGDSNLDSCTTYDYRIQAYRASDGQYSEYSEEVSATTWCYPNPPTNLDATAISDSQINLVWEDQSNNEGEFRIERSPNGITGWSLIGSVETNEESYPDTGLASCTTYFYRVYAYRAIDDVSSGYSNIDSAKTTGCTVDPPDVPTNLNTTAISSSQINLVWDDNSSDETSFKIERSLNGTTGWSQIASVGAGVESYPNTGLANCTTYYYRVRAYRSTDGQYSNYSPVANSKTEGCVLPTPSNLIATSISSSQINLVWDDNSSDETGFKIERSPNGTTNWSQIVSLGAGVESYSNTGLSSCTTYYYRVRAYRSTDGQYSNYSPVASSKTGGCVLPAPSNLRTTVISSSQIYLQWSDNSSDETSFKIERSLNGTTNWSQIVSVRAEVESYSNNTGLSSCTTYYYRVRAYRSTDSQYSSYSTTASATTLGCPNPDIEIRGSDLTILDGDLSPSLGDNTDFQEIGLDGEDWTYSYSIHNTGTGDLILRNTDPVVISGVNPLDFEVTELIFTIIPEGASTSFAIKFDPRAVGLRTAVVNIYNNVSEKNPYNFKIQGTGVKNCFPLMRTKTGSGVIPTASPLKSGGCSSDYTYHAGVDIEIISDPAEGYRIDNWSGTIADESTSIINTVNMPNSKHTVTVNYEPIPCYSLVISIEPLNSGTVEENIILGSACNSGYYEGTSLLLRAIENNKFIFSNWSGAVNSFDREVPLTMESNNQLSAEFLPCYGLEESVYPPEAGSIDIDPAPNCGGENYISGTVLSLTAQADPLFDFYGWSGDVTSSAEEVSLAMNADKTAAANFTARPEPSDKFNKSRPLNGATGQPTDVTLTWGENTLAVDYEVCVDTKDNDMCDAEWTSTGGEISYAVSELETNKAYYWQVVAKTGGEDIEANEGRWYTFTTGEPTAFTWTVRLETGQGSAALLSNGNEGDAHVTLSYILSDGSFQRRYLIIRGGSSITVSLDNRLAGMSGEVLFIKLESDLVIDVERVTQIPDMIPGGEEPNLTQPPDGPGDTEGSLWVVEEASTYDGQMVNILVSNPNSSAIDIDVTYNLKGGGTVERVVSVPAKDALTIKAHLEEQVGPDKEFTTWLQSEQRFSVEMAATYPNGRRISFRESRLEGVPVCYNLTLTADGNGAGLTAKPDHTIGCPVGEYTSGEIIRLTSSPDNDWLVDSWVGTDADGSTAVNNTVTMPEEDWTAGVVYEEEIVCYVLNTTHIGEGTDPGLSPANSPECLVGQFVEGQVVNLLSAIPASGWEISSWTNTNLDSSTANSNSVTMPSEEWSVSVTYAEIPVPCYSLILEVSGSGGTAPTADPSSSASCSAGEYVEGETIDLTAHPSVDWHVQTWSGTDDDGSIAASNTLTMPADPRTVTIAYEEDSIPTVQFEDSTYQVNEDAGTVTLRVVLSEPSDGTLRVYANQTPGTADTDDYTHSYGYVNFYTVGQTYADLVLSITNDDLEEGSETFTYFLSLPVNCELGDPIAAEVTIIDDDTPACYELTLSHTGEGFDPTVSPIKSTGCTADHTYSANEDLTFTAEPLAGYEVAGWNNTDNDSLTTNSNTLTMPGSPWTVSVDYQISIPFTDDFSTQMNWIDESNGNIYRDATNEWLYWHVYRRETRRYYIPISISSDQVELSFKINVTANYGNGNVLIGLIEELTGGEYGLYGYPSGATITVNTESSMGVFTHPWIFYQERTHHGIWNPDNPSSFINLGGLGDWYTLNLTINGTSYSLEAYNAGGTHLGTVSGTMPETHAHYKYLMVFRDTINIEDSTETQTGYLDDIVLNGTPISIP